jgi:hypothetical protein
MKDSRKTRETFNKPQAESRKSTMAGGGNGVEFAQDLG